MLVAARLVKNIPTIMHDNEMPVKVNVLVAGVTSGLFVVYEIVAFEVRWSTPVGIPAVE